MRIAINPSELTGTSDLTYTSELLSDKFKFFEALKEDRQIQALHSTLLLTGVRVSNSLVLNFSNMVIGCDVQILQEKKNRLQINLKTLHLPVSILDVEEDGINTVIDCVADVIHICAIEGYQFKNKRIRSISGTFMVHLHIDSGCLDGITFGMDIGCLTSNSYRDSYYGFSELAKLMKNSHIIYIESADFHGLDEYKKNGNTVEEIGYLYMDISSDISTLPYHLDKIKRETGDTQVEKLVFILERLVELKNEDMKAILELLISADFRANFVILNLMKVNGLGFCEVCFQGKDTRKLIECRDWKRRVVRVCGISDI